MLKRNSHLIKEENKIFHKNKSQYESNKCAVKTTIEYVSH